MVWLEITLSLSVKDENDYLDNGLVRRSTIYRVSGM